MNGDWGRNLANQNNLCGRFTKTGQPCGQARRYNWGREVNGVIKPDELPSCQRHATPSERRAVTVSVESKQAALWRRWRA